MAASLSDPTRLAWSACVTVSLWIGLAGPATAQHRIQDWRLTVRPREVATATQNPAAGTYSLSPDSSVMVTVPPQCVGAHRCPLVVALPGGGFTATFTTDWLRRSVDDYGLILLATTWEGPPSKLSAAMTKIMRQFAIDPTKIAIIGRCASAAAGALYARANPDVFNRAPIVSSGLPMIGRGDNPQPEDYTTGPLFAGGPLEPPGSDNKTEYLIDDGMFDGQPSGTFLAAVRTLRRYGYTVTEHVGLRDHSIELEDNEYVAYWLQRSWAYPNPATRPKPVVVADPLPVLTPEALAKMTAFWGRFAKQPDSIRVTGRQATLREVSVPVWTEQVTTWLTDMAALAAKYPSVAADLTAAGLTAQQHDAYRVALLSALFSGTSDDMEQKLGPLDPHSVVAKNLAFVTATPMNSRH